jgi:hypothetical protein
MINSQVIEEEFSFLGARSFGGSDNCLPVSLIKIFGKDYIVK